MFGYRRTCRQNERFLMRVPSLCFLNEISEKRTLQGMRLSRVGKENAIRQMRCWILNCGLMHMKKNLLRWSSLTKLLIFNTLDELGTCVINKWTIECNSNVVLIPFSNCARKSFYTVLICKRNVAFKHAFFLLLIDDYWRVIHRDIEWFRFKWIVYQ